MASTPVKKHPNAGKTMIGAEMVLEVLAQEGVDTIFGYSGGAILPTYDGIFKFNARNADRPLNLVVPANEQGAGFMAAGYARATGKVGICVVTSGPGATNTVTPVRDCMADSIPIIVITGQVPRASIGTDAFQEAPVYNTMMSCAKHVFLVQNPEDLEATIRTAFWIALSGRPGPVVIDIPKDVQNWEGVFKGEGTLKFRGYQQRLDTLVKVRLTKPEIKAFFSMLKASKRPLIYAGGGVINAGAEKELAQFSKMFQIPVVTTLMGIGGVDTTEPLSLHMLGMHGTAYANYAVDDCDFLIAIGARFDDRVAGKVESFAARAKIAHIDIDAAEIGKVKLAHWSHVGDARMALKDLIAAGKGFKYDVQAWVKHVLALKKAHPMNFDRESDRVQPQEVLAELNKITKGNAIITTGVGQHQMFAAQFIDFTKPRTWLTSGSMGTMGFGVPAAIGAWFGQPDKTVICVDGDGSIRMNWGEMETATTYRTKVKVLLLNNMGDGMVRQWQRLMFEERFIGIDKSLHRRDFVKSAEADGFEFSRRVSEKGQLVKALKDFVKFDKGPAFLEVMVDPDSMVFPMVGPAKSYREMLTGPFIPTREDNGDIVEIATSEGF